MATIVKEEVPIEVRREIPGIPRRRLSSGLMLAVVVALVIGLVAGAAGWQATRGTSAAESTGNATSATQKLAEKYVAAGLFTRAQYAMFSKNAYVEIVAGWASGSGTSASAREAAFTTQYAYSNVLRTEKLVFVGATGFVTEWTAKGSSGPMSGKPFTAKGTSVSTVKDGKIVRQIIYYDPSQL
jgi:hypothetical protein